MLHPPPTLCTRNYPGTFTERTDVENETQVTSVRGGYGDDSMQAATTLTRRGRYVRVAVTLLTAGLLLAGTLWGDDDHFPFGPFKMYASAVDPDAPAEDTRVEAIDVHGDLVLITPGNSGIRRAEFEGQLPRFAAAPQLLQAVADAYQRRNPQAAPLQELRVVIRWHEVRDFEVTGQWEEEVVATWRP